MENNSIVLDYYEIAETFKIFFENAVKNFNVLGDSDSLSAGIILPNTTINILVGLQLFAFLWFLFLLSIRQDNLSIKSRNALLSNIGRVSLINFVTINLLGGFSCFFLGTKVKAFIRANTKYAS